MTEIYALYSTQDGRVRYVGRSGDRRLRFKEHVRSAESWPDETPLSRWFHQSWRHGHPVRYALLEVCDDDREEGVETEWIQRFPRRALLNQRKLRSPWWLDPRKLPVVPEIVTYMRRHIFNVSGHRGVHHDRDTGYYRVLVFGPPRRPPFPGHWVDWLEGDELPGGSASIWFSDLARALSARDNEEDFYRTLMKARRQKDIVASGAWEQERNRKEDYGW